MVRAVRRWPRRRPVSRRTGRLRDRHRRRDRQLPAQRAARLHRPARRRQRVVPDSGDPTGTRGWPVPRWRTSGTGIRRAGCRICPGRGSAFPRCRACWPPPGGRSGPPGSGCPGTPCTATTTTCCRARYRPTGWLRDFPSGAVKYVTPPDDLDAAESAGGGSSAAKADALMELSRGRQLAVTADPGRAPVTRAYHVREHFRTAGSPSGTATPSATPTPGTAYYAFDHGVVRCVVMDTVNPHGGWQGSLDATQLGWLCRPSWPVRRPAGGAVQPPPDRDDGQRHRPARR